MLIVNHLGRSQSERIVWLCEELDIPYELKLYERDPATMLATPEYKALHPLGAAPVIEDGAVVLAESGAIVDYIVAKYGQGRLRLRPDDPDFAQFLYWFHFANGTLQAGLGRLMILNRLGLDGDNPMLRAMTVRLDRAMALVLSLDAGDGRFAMLDRVPDKSDAEDRYAAPSRPRSTTGCG